MLAQRLVFSPRVRLFAPLELERFTDKYGLCKSYLAYPTANDH